MVARRVKPSKLKVGWRILLAVVSVPLTAYMIVHRMNDPRFASLPAWICYVAMPAMCVIYISDAQKAWRARSLS
jgi:hypothetical protein